MPDDGALSRIERLLADRIGLDPASIGHDEVARAVTRRCRARGVTAVSRYVDALQGDADEWAELIELVLVPETWFLREAGAFEQLARAAEMHATARSSREFRALSIPCATGEEPYSIAMVLLEAGLRPGTCLVDALDLSRNSVARAESGVYKGRAVRHVPPDWLERYFDAADAGHRVRPEVRALVRFSTGNLVDPRLLEGVAPYDVVFCRNVLIYLGPTARERVLGTLDRLVRHDGLLVTGHAETQRLVAPRFVRASAAGAFVYRKRGAAPDTGDAGRVRGSPSDVVRRPRHEQALGALRAVGDGERHPTGADRSTAGTRAAADADARLARARRLADEGHLAAARAELTALAASDPANADAHFLLGVVELGGGWLVAAENALRRALYLDPRHEEALLCLATVRQRRGDEDDAARLRRRAARAAHRGSHGA